MKRIIAGSILLSAAQVAQAQSEVSIETTSNCESQDYVFGPRPACQTSSQTNGYVATFSGPVCEAQLCAGNMTLRVSLQAKSVEPCCKRCTCYGDPHCVSFSGKKEVLVECDARTLVKNKDWCPLTREMCVSQKDIMGDTCVWQPDIVGPKGKVLKWNVGLYGSQCIPGNPYTSILMYKVDDFSFSAGLGERSVIKNLQYNSGGNEYVLTSDQCFESGFPGLLKVKSNVDARLERLSKSPTHIVYLLTDNAKGIVIKFTCVRTYDIKVKKFGQTRFNVDDLYQMTGEPPGASGFCVTGKLNKGQSTTNQKAIDNCQDNPPEKETEMTSLLCGPYSTTNECINNYCKDSRNPDNCVANINTYSWPKVWCTDNTMRSQDPSECESNAQCSKCVRTLMNNGFEAVSTSFAKLSSDNPSCVSAATVLSLGREASRSGIANHAGVHLQYQSGSSWVTYGVVPHGYSICTDLVFNSGDFPEVFQGSNRVYQTPATTNACSSSMGFETRFRFKAAPKMCVCPGQDL